jgi:hypothetical protein
MLWSDTFSEFIKTVGNANFQDVKDQILDLITSDSETTSPTIINISIPISEGVITTTRISEKVLGNPIYGCKIPATRISERGFSGETFTTCKYCSEHRAKSDQIEVSGDETV